MVDLTGIMAISTLFDRDTDGITAIEKLAFDGRFKIAMWHHGMHGETIYSEDYMTSVAKALNQHDMFVRDVHGSHGGGKCWSQDENQRQIGVALIRNRIDLAYRLNAQVVTLHLARTPGQPEVAESHWEAVFRTLDDLAAYARARNVLIALENLHYENWDNYTGAIKVLARYDRDYVGVCYDSGHGNIDPSSLDLLRELKDRLVALHLNDNLGKHSGDEARDDMHMLPYAGTVTWPEVAQVIGTSSYSGPISLEVGRRNHPENALSEFLGRASESGAKFYADVQRGSG